MQKWEFGKDLWNWVEAVPVLYLKQISNDNVYIVVDEIMYGLIIKVLIELSV